MAAQDIDRAGVVGDDDVEMSVPVEVGDGDVVCTGAGVEWEGGPQRAVTVA